LNVGVPRNHKHPSRASTANTTASMTATMTTSILRDPDSRYAGRATTGVG
jgi:hypothetical protein